jgi:hypothetical protein
VVEAAWLYVIEGECQAELGRVLMENHFSLQHCFDHNSVTVLHLLLVDILSGQSGSLLDLRSQSFRHPTKLPSVH